MSELKWIHRVDPNTFPKIDGWYRVMVAGDSESIDGHTIYAFDDYETWAHYSSHAPDEGGSFVGTCDEDNDCIFAFCGPITFPEYKAD